MARKIVIYTRYSTDMQNPKSCDDQEREVREGLARRGIDATQARVVHDRGESGTHDARPRYEELRQSILSGQVGLLAVDDQARFSRGLNVYGLVIDLVYRGGRFVSTGEDIDTYVIGWELKVRFMELHNSMHIAELGRRVRRGQLGRVLGDLSAGDLCFGYESYILDPKELEGADRGPKPRKGIRIDDQQARWVIQIFEWFAAHDWSLNEIARELTRQGVSKGHRSKKRVWDHQDIRDKLTNRKYIGVWTWGATHTIRDSSGRKKQVPVPKAQIAVRSRPELRIIPEDRMDLWDAAQAKLAALKQRYGQKPGQKPRGPKPHYSEDYPQNLLAGLIVCGKCGSRLWQCGSGDRKYLGCPNRGKGPGMCPMRTRMRVDHAEVLIIEFVRDLFTRWPEWMRRAMDVMRQRIGEHARRVPAELEAARKRLAEIEPKIESIVDQLVNQGFESEALKGRLTELESEAERLKQTAEKLETHARRPVELPDDAWVKKQLADLTSVLGEDVRRSARFLRELFGEVKAHEIIPPGKRRGYIQLKFRVSVWSTFRQVLGDRLPECWTASVSDAIDDQGPEFTLDLGGPTRMDDWGPKIAEMRSRKPPVHWEEIQRITGLGSGPAYVAWKRWVDAQDADPAA